MSLLGKSKSNAKLKVKDNTFYNYKKSSQQNFDENKESFIKKPRQETGKNTKD